jgi:MFS family permease
MAKGRGLTTCLKHRDYRFFIGAFTFAGIGGWAYTVALVVWVFQETGSVGWITAATVVRLVPALLFGTYAGVIADRFEKVKVMRLVDLACAGVMVGLAFLMIMDAPAAAVIGLAAVSSSLFTLYEPAAAGLTPLIVPERDLASANALRNTIDNSTIIVGPSIGALMLLVAPTELAVLLNAGTCLISAMLLGLMRTRSVAVDVTEGGSAGPVRQMLVGIKAMGSSVSTAVMVGFSILATFAFGVDTVLFVAASDDVLGTGPDGYGYLLAGLGLGGILAAPIVARAESSPLLGPIIIGGMAGYCLPTLVFVFTDSPQIAFAAQVVRGAGTMFVDVLAETAMQRTLPNDVLSRVFGAFNTMMILVILLGSSLTSLSITQLGLDTTVWLAGVGLFGLSLLGLPWLINIDRVARKRRAELAPRIDLLEACDLFEQVDDGDLTQLAATGEELVLPAGATVVVEDEDADAFYVVVSGVLGVTSSGAGAGTIPDLVAGDYFGEIGPMEGIQRTATVTTSTDATILRFPGGAFLDALTAYQPSVAVMEGAALRLRRTHPTRGLHRAGVTEGEAR